MTATPATQTVASRKLDYILRRVIDHAGPDDQTGLHAVRLEFDGRHLYAIATDRYTLAVARETVDSDLNNLDGETQPFTVNLTPRDAAYLAQIADYEDDGEPWEAPTDYHTRLTVGGDGNAIVTARVLVREKEDADSYSETASVKFLAAENVVEFDWRELFRGALAKEPDGSLSDGAFTVQPRLLARWMGPFGTDPLHVRVTGKLHALVLVGSDFLGLQMPVQPRESWGESFAAHYATWQNDLTGGSAGA